MERFKLDDSILKQISGGISGISDAELAEEIDPLIQSYKRMTYGADAEALKQVGLDEGHKGLLLYIQKARREGKCSLTDEGYRIFEDYITRKYDSVS